MTFSLLNQHASNNSFFLKIKYGFNSFVAPLCCYSSVISPLQFSVQMCSSDDFMTFLPKNKMYVEVTFCCLYWKLM